MSACSIYNFNQEVYERLSLFEDWVRGLWRRNPCFLPTKRDQYWWKLQVTHLWVITVGRIAGLSLPIALAQIWAF